MMAEPRWKKRKIKLSKIDYARQREQIFESQDYICLGCGRRRPLTRDHRVKRSQGGGDERSNAQGLCAECHCRKDEYTDRIHK